jgi:ribose transport system substrate-binding protein
MLASAAPFSLRAAVPANPATVPRALGRTQAQKPLVVFCQDTTANDYRAAQVRAAVAWFAENLPECRFVVRDAGGSVVQQIRDITWASDAGAAVILLGAAGGYPLAPALQEARANGAMLIGISRLVPTFVFDALVTGNNFAIGAAAARFLAQRRPEGGRVAMLEGLPGSSTARQRSEGFRMALSALPQWRLVATAPADYLRHRAALVVEAWHREGVRYDALFAHSDSMLAGARWAWRRLGVDPASLTTIGVDYIAEARAALLAGTQTASVCYPLMVAEAGELVRKALAGEPLPLRHEVATPLIVDRDAAQKQPIF